MQSQPESAAPAAAPAFKRVLLKLSGEALSGDQEFGIDHERVESLAAEIVSVHESGIEVAIVVGGGNIFRGMERAAAGMDRATADYAGMLATVLNSLTIQDALERRFAQTRVSRRSRSPRSPSRTSAGGRFATSRKAES